jgi:hypothetical protein
MLSAELSLLLAELVLISKARVGNRVGILIINKTKGPKIAS